MKSMCSNGLKGQQLSAQGNALGKVLTAPTPCKGKSGTLFTMLLPFQGVVCTAVYTQGVALGYSLHCPFRARYAKLAEAE